MRMRVKDNFWEENSTIFISCEMEEMVGEIIEVEPQKFADDSDYLECEEWVWDLKWLEPVVTLEAEEL